MGLWMIQRNRRASRGLRPPQNNMRATEWEGEDQTSHLVEINWYIKGSGKKLYQFDF